MSLSGQIARNTVIQIVGKGIALVATVATIALMTRHLGSEQYGYYVTAFAVLQVAFIVVDLGLQMTTVTLIADPRENPERMLANLLGLRTATAAGAAVVAAAGIWLTPYPAVVKISVGVLALTFVTTDIAMVLTGLFQHRLQMGRVALAESVGKIIQLGLVALAVWFGRGLYVMLAAFVVSGLVQTGLLVRWAQHLLPIRLAADLAQWKKIISVTWPLAVTIAFNLIYFKMDTVILSLARSPQEVGWYGAPYRVLEVCINLAYLFLGLILPLLAHAAATQNRERFAYLLQRGLDAMAIAGVPLVFGGWLVSRPLMVLVAGSEFAESGPLLSILLVATVVIFLAAVFGYGIVALGQQRKLIPVFAANAVLALAAYLWLIPKYGAPAAAWLTVGSESVILVASASVTYRLIKFIPSLQTFGLAVGAGAVMSAVLWLLSGWPVLVRIGISAGVYLMVLRWIGGIPRGLLREVVKLETSSPTTPPPPAGGGG